MIEDSNLQIGACTVNFAGKSLVSINYHNRRLVKKLRLIIIQIWENNLQQVTISGRFKIQ